MWSGDPQPAMLISRKMHPPAFSIYALLRFTSFFSLFSKMLVPLTREKFEQLVPLVATGEQFQYCWGKWSDLLKRLLISVLGVTAAFLLRWVLPEGFDIIEFVPGVISGLYWLWGPAYRATRINAQVRKYKYSGFLRGKVLDAFPTEELIGQEETVNKRGDLVIVENRERRLNLVVGDETGFSATIQVPLQRDHRSIRPRDSAELVVFSNRPDLSRISKVSDVYLPDYDLWVSDYPYLSRNFFNAVSRQIQPKSKRYRS